MRVPYSESLVSGPRLQHLAPHLKSQVSGQSPKFRLQAPGPNPLPGAWRRFPLSHRYCSRHVIQCKYGLGSARRTSEAGAALKNESYCCHFCLVFDIKLFIDIRNMGVLISQQHLFCVLCTLFLVCEHQVRLPTDDGTGRRRWISKSCRGILILMQSLSDKQGYTGPTAPWSLPFPGPI